MQSAQAVSTRFLVKPQAFETGVFGAPVWRLEAESEEAMDGAALDRLTIEARAHGVALIAVRLPGGQAAGSVLSRAGFRSIERLLTFCRDIPVRCAPVAGVKLAKPDDAEACAAIGRRSFSFDRFHTDPQLPDAAADEIKARWAYNGVSGRANAPLILRETGAVAGFNLCMRRGGDAVIDLIAVDRPWRGRSLGRKLVEGALAHYAGVARTMWVSTQDTNAASIALYRGAGFALHHAAHTWHWTP
jgi:ribosomal protein S18 acetylase RimI-like enzyme